MLRSMTAFGKANVTTSIGLFLVEIHSVNRRALDISVYLPRDLLCIDMDIRKWISEAVKRGHVMVRVIKEMSKKDLEFALPHIDLIQSLKAKWEKIAKDLGYDPKEVVTLSFLADQLEEVSYPAELEDEEVFRKEFHLGFKKALSELTKMKEREGEALGKDITPRITQIERWLKEIEKLSSGTTMRYREKLLKRINELSIIGADDQERIDKEVLFFADKADISEEITRLYSHIEQFRLYLKKERAGRSLDFLLQEMHREVNTIGSKSQDLEISKRGLDIKGEVEKIKEQVQNVE